MAYGVLTSPLPGLTVTSTGERCCGMRGSADGLTINGLGYQPGAHALLGLARESYLRGMLGQDPSEFDTTSTDVTGDLTDTSGVDQVPIDFGGMTELPLPNQLSPSLDSLYPTTVGTEFTSNGDGSYTNIQTGQTVPYSIAQQITEATGAPTVDTTATGQNLTITDPATGATSSVNTNNLTVAAQALQAAGQLVNAAGKLTAQGQALLGQGNLYKAPPATGPLSNLFGAMSSLTSWMGGSTMIAGVPNLVIILGVPMAFILIGSLATSRGKGRRR